MRARGRDADIRQPRHRTALSPDTGYTGGGIAFPVGLALDAAGQVRVANQGASQVSEFATDGVALSPLGGYAVAGLAVPQSIAVDESDNIWVTNAYGDSVTELTDQGAALSGPHGYTGGGLTCAARTARRREGPRPLFSIRSSRFRSRSSPLTRR